MVFLSHGSPPIVGTQAYVGGPHAASGDSKARSAGTSRASEGVSSRTTGRDGRGRAFRQSVDLERALFGPMYKTAAGNRDLASFGPARRRGVVHVKTTVKGDGLKLVIGIVRPERTNEVLAALYRAEVRGLSISRVQGHGGETERVETYRGTTVMMGLADKVRFEIAVSDSFVEPTVNAIIEGARTGDVGDGKIFVLPLERVVRIRSGEADTAAVTPREMAQ